MNRKIKIAYLLILGNKNLYQCRPVIKSVTSRETAKVFEFLSDMDIGPVPWFGVRERCQKKLK